MGAAQLEGTAKGKRWSRLAPIAFSLLVALVISEVVVRSCFRYNTPDTVREHSLQFLPTVYARHVLKQSQRVELDKAWGIRTEAEATGQLFEINEKGFRGRSIAQSKPSGGCRVAALGGSAVFDIRADEGEDWPHLLENQLRAAGLRMVEVINAGVPGYATADSLGRLFTQVWMLEPDVVLLSNAWNDIKYFRRLAPEQPLLLLTRPYDEAADPFRSYRGPIDRLLSNSQLYVKLRNRYLIWKLNVGNEGAAPASELAASYSPLAIRQYRLNVELFVDASRNIGARPVLLTQPSLIAAENGPAERQRISYEYAGLDHAALVRAFEECNEVVRSVAQVKGAWIVDLAAGMNGRSEFFADHVHTTRRGSEEIARVVSGFLAGRLDAVCPQAAP